MVLVVVIFPFLLGYFVISQVVVLVDEAMVIRLLVCQGVDGSFIGFTFFISDMPTALTAYFIPQSEICNPQSECRLFTSHGSNSMSRAKEQTFDPSRRNAL